MPEVKLRCRLNLHRWGKWQTVPITSKDPASGWAAGQLRQCADCFLLQSTKVGNGYAFNTRPLRMAVGKHIEVLRQLENEEMEKAADDLSEALNADLAVPKE